MAFTYQYPIDLYLDGKDEPLRVLADHRDLRAWAKASAPGGPYEWAQGLGSVSGAYIGWAAARRLGLTADPYDVFEQQLAGVDEIVEQTQPVDPTPAPTSDG